MKGNVILAIGVLVAAIITIIVLVIRLTDEDNAANSFFNNQSSSEASRTELEPISSSRTELEPIESSIENNNSSTQDSNSSSEGTISSPQSRPEIEITKFFNSHTHPDLFYIKSTGFEYTQLQEPIKAIVTEGYTTEGDKITGTYMIVYPMLGFKPEVFDQHTNDLYSFYDFEPQDDGSYRLDITSGVILEYVQHLSASTSMLMLAAQAHTLGILILDENGTSYTITKDGNLAIISKGEVKPIPDSNSNSNSDIKPDSNSSQAGTTSSSVTSTGSDNS